MRRVATATTGVAKAQRQARERRGWAYIIDGAHEDDYARVAIQYEQDRGNAQRYATQFKCFTIFAAVFNASAVSICFIIAIYAWPQTNPPAQKALAISEGLHTTVPWYAEQSQSGTSWMSDEAFLRYATLLMWLRTQDLRLS